MLESRSRLTVEAVLYGLALMFAAVLRLSSLGWLPLNDAESAEALAAAPSGYDLLRGAGEPETFPISPSYQLLTSALFVLFGPRDTIARVVPALAGVMLVAAPILLRRRMGKPAALIASGLLAISPTMVAVSRTAGGTSLSLLGLALVWLLLAEARHSEGPSRYLFPAGICAALAITSGPSAYQGLLSVLLAVLLLSALKLMPSLGLDQASRRTDIVQGFLLGLISVVGVSYLAGVTPSALAGMFSAAGSWLSGWGRLGDLPGLSAVLLLPIYEPLVLVIGAIGAMASVRASGLRDIGVGAALWALSSLILIFAYPSRRPEDLAWVVLPLVLLAALGIEWGVQRMVQSEVLWPSMMLVAVLLILGSFSYIQLSAVIHGSVVYAEVASPLLKTALVAAPFLIAALIILVFGFGWSWAAAGEASMTAGAIMLLMLNVSACWRVNYPPRMGSVELWRPTAITPELHLLKSTVGRIALVETGREESIDLVVRGQASPVLAWTFYAALTGGLPADESQPEAPIEIIREMDLTEDMASRYTGQTFALREKWGWTGALPPDFLRWWVSRDAATVPERWLLLVPGGMGLEEAPPR